MGGNPARAVRERRHSGYPVHAQRPDRDMVHGIQADIPGVPIQLPPGLPVDRSLRRTPLRRLESRGRARFRIGNNARRIRNPRRNQRSSAAVSQLIRHHSDGQRHLDRHRLQHHGASGVDGHGFRWEPTRRPLQLLRERHPAHVRPVSLRMRHGVELEQRGHRAHRLRDTPRRRPEHGPARGVQ